MRLSAGRTQPLHPHDPQDVEATLSPLLEAAKTCGLTAGIIDHSKKGRQRQRRVLDGRGGGKEQVVDAIYFWTRVEPYNVDTARVVKICGDERPRQRA